MCSLIVGDFNEYPDIGIEWDTWTTQTENINSEEYRFIESLRDSYLYYQHVNKKQEERGQISQTCWI